MKHVYKSLEPIYDEVEYNGKDYRLVELDVPGVAEYKSAAAASIKFDDKGGMSRLAGSGDLDPLAVKLSLREVLPDGKLGKLSKTFLDSLPPQMVKDLAIRVREITPALDETPSIEALDKQIERLTELRVMLAEGVDPNGRRLNGTAKSSV